MIVLDEFLLRALLGGLATAAAAAPLGCVILWRRMAFVGATLAHAALLGVGMGLLLNIGAFEGVLALSLMLGIVISLAENNERLPSDTILNIMAHGSLALGLVVVSYLTGARVDLMALLFGDILALSWGDVIWCWCGALVVLALIGLIWNRLIAVIASADLAQLSGINVGRVRLAFGVMVALAVSIGMQAVGLVLVVAILVMPAAAARGFARTPIQMVGYAALMGALAVTSGLGLSMQVDWPTGPAIVVTALGLFLLSLLMQALRRQISTDP